MHASRFALVLLVIGGLPWYATPGNSFGQERLEPFTRPARSIRTRPFEVEHIKLDLRFDFDKQQVDGRVTQRLRPFAPTQRVELDAVDMQIERVALLAASAADALKELAFDQHDQSLAIELPREVAAHEMIELEIDYRLVQPQQGVQFVVPDESEPQREPIVWTQSQPESARYWFPCIDSPNVRLTSEMIATVPNDFFVLSNGVLHRTKDNGDGTQTWHWIQEQDHVPYLISVVAGRFEAYEQSWDGIPIISYVPPGRLEDAERSFGKTPEMMQFFSEKIGYRYPWPKYTQICCDEFGGGMEHTSATTLTLETLHDQRAHLDVSSDNLVAHELVHQWWGNLLTCKDWAELWLNEGFATYFATLWKEHDLGFDEATWQRYREAESYRTEDTEAYRRPIVTYRYPEPISMFDRHSYPKGGRVLHMLRFVLGDDLFWEAMRHYCHKHAFSVVETADLRVAIEEATGQGLNWFFDQWVYRGGHPEYDVSYRWDEAEGVVRLTVKQVQAVDELTPLFRMPVEIDLVTDRETIRRRITVAKEEETFVLSLPSAPRRVVFDPQDWILKELDFKKSKRELIDQLAHDPHVVPRVQAAEGLKKCAPDGDALAALIAAATGDSFWAVREAAVKSLASFGGESARETLWKLARHDDKSAVRRAAVTALEDFPHEQTAAVLREAIADDPSYFVVADALRTLVEVQGDAARADLLAAIERTSHREVILTAACDGLAELGADEARPLLLELLEVQGAPQRRVAAFKALAKVGRGDPTVTEALARQLNNTRDYVSRAAAVALGETGDRAAIETLLARRPRALHPRTVAAIDAAVSKLRNTNSFDELRREVESLKSQKRLLEERIESLEKAATP